MAKTLPCGCVEGFYWCAKHDIYVKQDRANDPRWKVGDFDKIEECTCHLSAPCSFCANEEAN